MRVTAGVAMLLVFVSQMAGTEPAPRFEVATLKLAFSEGDSYPITAGLVNGSRLNLTNVTLSDCLKFAYGLVSDEQISGPEWIWSWATISGADFGKVRIEDAGSRFAATSQQQWRRRA